MTFGIYVRNHSLQHIYFSVAAFFRRQIGDTLSGTGNKQFAFNLASWLLNDIIQSDNSIVAFRMVFIPVPEKIIPVKSAVAAGACFCVPVPFFQNVFAVARPFQTHFSKWKLIDKYRIVAVKYSLRFIAGKTDIVHSS